MQHVENVLIVISYNLYVKNIFYQLILDGFLGKISQYGDESVYSTKSK